MKKRITSISIQRIPDYDEDHDYLGRFSNTPNEYAVEHNGDRGTYKYFNAENVENMKQARKNYNRIMRFENGELSSLGIKAFANIQTGYGSEGSWLCNTIHSGGLWGFDSDYDEAELKEQEKEQLADIKEVLAALGFTKKQIDSAPIKYD